MSETTEALQRALRRAGYERMRDLLQDPRAAEAAMMLPNPSSRAIALLTRLMQHDRSLWEDRQRLYEQRALGDDEVEVVIPSHDLPLPDDLSEIRYRGMRLRVGGIDDHYRVAPVEIVRHSP